MDQNVTKSLHWRHRAAKKLSEQTNSDDKEVVRSVKVFLHNSGNKDDKRILEQPIVKIVLLLKVEDVDSLTKGWLT